MLSISYICIPHIIHYTLYYWVVESPYHEDFNEGLVLSAVDERLFHEQYRWFFRRRVWRINDVQENS